MRPHNTNLTPDQAQRLATAITRLGPVRVAERLGGLDPQTIVRAAVSLPIQRGTRALIAAHLDAIEPRRP
jgi:hypothetical protein